ncbi:hypothetical protein TNCV_308751 [Trichonephila clavipes]|nr:hypothetical protein TNCV_308751 [Trichonephila clavipes]
MRRPGIEPESQEWESCMIPLHQRRLTQMVQSNETQSVRLNLHYTFGGSMVVQYGSTIHRKGVLTRG